MTASTPSLHLRCVLVFTWLILAGISPLAATAATNVYSTSFEAGEGYSTNLDLIGQNGWTGQGSGGNGVVTKFFPGQGQQAYIGFSPPNPTNAQLFVWHPLNYTPLAANTPVVTFSVLMAITDSSNGEYDDFLWSVFNSRGDNLFALDFFNGDTGIYYLLGGDTSYVPTGRSFTNGVTYSLAITMNFSQNAWSATLDGRQLVTNAPITTTGATMDLGDVDAVWLPYYTNAPGDNYMIFDNYQVTAVGIAPPPATLQTFGRTSDGLFLLRLLGASGYAYAIDASSDLRQWTPLKTNVVTGGYFDMIDTTAPGFPLRFYRGRLVQ